MKKISVIVPVFNREKTICRCIDSILSSSYKNIELILVDDGSTDNSWKIIQNYQDSRIIALHKMNGGVSSARNYGLKYATGDYIHFVDSDDFINGEIYEECMNRIQNENPDMILFDYTLYFESTKEKYPANPFKIEANKLLNRQYIVDEILSVLANLSSKKENFIENYSWIKLYRNELIQKYKVKFDETKKRWEDRIFQILFLKYAQSFFYVDKAGYYYVLGNSCFSDTYDKSIFYNIINSKYDYKEILFDLNDCNYDFDSQYTNNYYCKVMIKTILSQFDIKTIDKTELKNDLMEILSLPRSIELFTKFSPTSKFDCEVKKLVLNHNFNKLFDLYKRKHLVNKLRKKLKL